MDAPHVWVAKDDGSDIIRAAAIVGMGIDYDGHVTARMAGRDVSAVTLVVPGSRPHPPGDFHRELIRIIAELADAAGAFMVRPVCEEPRGWRWVTEAL
jgi:hypothetical protein